MPEREENSTTVPSRDTRLFRQVYNLYTRYCDALYNRLYYSRRLKIIKGWNTSLEVLLAVGTSSVIGSWALWGDEAGGTAWTILAGTAALLAVVKPVLQLTKQVERYTRLFTGYGDAFFDLDLLVSEVQSSEDYPPEIDGRLRDIQQRLKELATEDDPIPSKELEAKLRGEVQRIRPKETFWWPKSAASEASHEQKKAEGTPEASRSDNEPHIARTRSVA